MVDCLPSKQEVWVQISLFALQGDITQLVECMLCKHEAIGSNPIISILLNDITQLVEWWNHNPYVTGSSPVIINYQSAEYGAAGSAPVLGTGGHAFKSHYSDLENINKYLCNFYIQFYVYY